MSTQRTLSEERKDALLEAIARAVKEVQGDDVPPILYIASVELADGKTWHVHFRGRAELPLAPKETA